MANLVSTCDNPSSVRAPTVRRAFYLPSQGVPLFAWLHQGSARAQHGVIVCAPAGHEQVHTHRALRHLAKQVAETGCSVVRFDFAGTGDSADLPPGVDVHAAWLTNLRDVIFWMRNQLGCEQIGLMGLRLGAMIATQIAADEAIDGLVLWEPVVNGRAYARELKALSLAGGGAPGLVEPAGFMFHVEHLDAMSRIDLLKVHPHCRRALILARDDMPANGKFASHLTSLGIETEQAVLTGYADMMAEPHATQVPEAAIAAMVRWVVASAPSVSLGTTSTRGEASDATIMAVGSVRERIVQISAQPDLFGILSEPEQASTRPLIVLPNAGSAYRIGPNRLYVALARQLAQHGFRTLRMDINGLGDSIGADPERENDCYPETAFRDIDLTLRFAQTELGAERALLMGLCSGAYVAFQSAAQIVNPLLVESILINPLTFYWQTGMTIDNNPAREEMAYRYYLESMLQPKKWLKLLSGKTTIGFGGALKMLASRIGLGCRPEAAGPMTESARLGHPARNDLPGDLERIERKERQLAFFFARSDPGHAMLMSAAGRKVKQLDRAGKISVHFIENADHTFARQSARQALIDAICVYLGQRF